MGKNGRLDEAPTLRTWLLDYLGQIDAAAAGEYGRLILSNPDSSDEWALALRNLAMGDTSAGRAGVAIEKNGELLNNPAWQQNPSSGYLEAFDAAVYLGGTNFVPTLAGMVSSRDNPAVAHAAFLAMDRLAIKDPTSLLSALLAQPEIMQTRYQTRADYFARADVSNSQQLNLLENYLLNPQISAAEVDTFAGVFPNVNYMLSPNLFTQTQTPDHTAFVNRDSASLSVVQQWIADPRFVALHPYLEKTQARLAGYIQQASQ